MQRIKITVIKDGGAAEGLGLKVDDVLDTFAGAELDCPRVCGSGCQAGGAGGTRVGALREFK